MSQAFVDTTLTPAEREEILQWNRLRAVQLRLQYLRLQFHHRNTIHLGIRPNLYANLQLTDWSRVSSAEKSIPENERADFRPTLRAVARWYQTGEWAVEAMDAAKGCRLLDYSTAVKAKIFIVLEMVISASRGTPIPQSALYDKSLDVDQRRRVPIQLVRRSLRYLDQCCRVHLLEAEASLTVLMNSILGSLPPPEGFEEKELNSLRNTIKNHIQISEQDLKKARALLTATGRDHVKKKDIQKNLRVGSDKAQSILDQLRFEGTDKSIPRKRRKKHRDGPATP